MIKTCIICGKIFETKYNLQKTCTVECSKLRKKETNEKYRNSDKGKEYNRIYDKSDKMKEYRKKYRNSDKMKEYIKILKESGKLKEYQKKYIKSDKGKMLINSNKYKEYRSKRSKKIVNNLTNGYIALCFRLPINQIPPELIELKRLQIKILRECKNS